LDKNFESKSIKEEGKVPLWTVQTIYLNFKTQISQINNNNNNYVTAPTSSNPYITRKLNNMDEARMIKAERDDWTKTYHKILKDLEVMIDIQRQIKKMLKIVAETNTTMTEIEDSILTASVNNQTVNATNITGVSEDL